MFVMLVFAHFRSEILKSIFPISHAGGERGARGVGGALFLVNF